MVNPAHLRLLPAARWRQMTIRGHRRNQLLRMHLPRLGNAYVQHRKLHVITYRLSPVGCRLLRIIRQTTTALPRRQTLTPNKPKPKQNHHSHCRLKTRWPASSADLHQMCTPTLSRLSRFLPLLQIEHCRQRAPKRSNKHNPFANSHHLSRS